MRSKNNSLKKYLIILIIILPILLISSTKCRLNDNSSMEDSELDIIMDENYDIDHNNKRQIEKINLKLLCQNTMLIPFDFVAPAFNERTGAIIDLIMKGYGIVCLQEVFDGNSQNRIISSWHDMIYQGTNNSTSSQWQTDYFNNWYDMLPDSDNNMWHPLTGAQSVSNLADNKNFWGVKILDKKVNDIPANIICSPYYIMGPDRGAFNIRQDSGLVILSKYPIIEGGAMTYSSDSGTDKLASKGIAYARIQIGPSADDYIHVFNTHIQSHDHSESRLSQISELVDYVTEIIKSDIDHIRPILIAGDFNIAAEKPDNWMELAGIAPPESEMSEDFDSKDKEILEYTRLEEIVKDFPSSSIIASNHMGLIDSWQKLNPTDPGFTWIGKDWNTSDDNSYGAIGNQIAVEDGGPQRIDYIFHFSGKGDLYLKPISISLVPGSPDLLYCFDSGTGSSNGCIDISLDSDCSFKSYTVSDHLGLELNFEIGINN